MQQKQTKPGGRRDFLALLGILLRRSRPGFIPFAASLRLSTLSTSLKLRRTGWRAGFLELESGMARLRQGFGAPKFAKANFGWKTGLEPAAS